MQTHFAAMEPSTSAASTLRAPRITIAIISAAAVASIGYFLYNAVYEPGVHDSDSSRRLHRSNAIRRRRRSLPQDRAHSDASSTSADSHTDDNVDDTLHPLGDGETVAEDPHTMEDDWWNDPASVPQQRAGQNIVSLLFRVSEDNARRNAYVHRGCACNGCNMVPIRGIRYRCANCADFDLCETCESQGLHIKTHIFYKVKVPGPTFGPRQSQPVWYPGDPEACMRNLPKSIMAKLSKETGFERPELEAYWEQWTFMANTEWREDPDDLCLAMDRRTFERCLVPSVGYRQSAPNLIHERMFAFYDTNNDDLIGFTEFLHGLSYKKRKDKLRKIFDGYDIDKDGYVSRKDFLRVFRAYYVLYKQLHKDILEGLDDQVLGSTEAHQLVSSRQPISSLFGREGRVPPPRGSRVLAGKSHENGETVVDDDIIRVVAEDRTETAERNVILSSLFDPGDTQTRTRTIHMSPLSDNSQSDDEVNSPRFLNALLRPPMEVDQLPQLLYGDTTGQGYLVVPDTAEDVQEDVGGWAEEGAGSDTENHVIRPVRPARASLVSPTGWINPDPQSPPGGPPIRHGDRDGAVPEAYLPRPLEPPSPERQLRQARQQALIAHSHRVAMAKRSQATIRRNLLERWKRRQFFLDEEEGAVPPEGWNDEEDHLGHMGPDWEGSKNRQHPPLSPRSRSSSKVRFADDEDADDDYEVRSNPSTSSRSVPERWGGMDIPDAERDAGKEILYQVTQQAFNELLDTLFEAKERMAYEAAATKDLRAKHRDLIRGVWLYDHDVDPTVKSRSESMDDFRNRSLDELLAFSGYSVDLTLEQGRQMRGPVLDGLGRIICEGGGDAADWTVIQASGGGEEYRDPTLPQFRPNSASEILPTAAEPSRSTTSLGIEPLPAPTDEKKPPSQWSKGKGRFAASTGKKKVRMEGTERISHWTLQHWKKLDEAENEAKHRGGWGKLSFEEFEEIYKAEEARENRLDYLGSWIDFCIP